MEYNSTLVELDAKPLTLIFLEQKIDPVRRA